MPFWAAFPIRERGGPRQPRDNRRPRAPGANADQATPRTGVGGAQERERRGGLVVVVELDDVTRTRPGRLQAEESARTASAVGATTQSMNQKCSRLPVITRR